MSNGEMERQPLRKKAATKYLPHWVQCVSFRWSNIKDGLGISFLLNLEMLCRVNSLDFGCDSKKLFWLGLQRESHAWLRNDHISSIFLPILYSEKRRIPRTLQSLTHHLERSLDARYYQSMAHDDHLCRKMPLINSCMILFILPRPKHFLTLFRRWLWESYIKPICNS